MKFRIDTLTTGLMLTVILLAGYSGCDVETVPEHADPYNQAAYGPVPANSRKPVKLPPFQEPSFERLIEQFKADVAENRGYPESIERKKEVIANPDLLWKPDFAVPIKALYDPALIGTNPFKDKIKILPYDQKGKPIWDDVRGYPGAIFVDYPVDKNKAPFTGKIFYMTKGQEERMDALPTTLPEDVRERKRLEILFEGIDTLTAAKYLMSSSLTRETFGLEYAVRAMRENPNSVEAMRVWVKCHPYDPYDERIEAYKQLLAKFPNAAFAHEDIAWYYYIKNKYALALEHIQKACQLDSRIAKKNSLLAKCYAKLGKWENSVAAYQGLSWIQRLPYSNSLDGIEKAQDKVYEQRKGYSYFGPAPKYIYDEKTRKLIIDKSKETE